MTPYQLERRRRAEAAAAVYSVITRKAQALVSAGTAKTLIEAETKVMTEDPSLYKAYKRARDGEGEPLAVVAAPAIPGRGGPDTCSCAGLTMTCEHGKAPSAA